jgi:hypothetical protein
VDDLMHINARNRRNTVAIFAVVCLAARQPASAAQPADEALPLAAKLNGKPVNRPWITHAEIVSGETLEFEMDSLPSTEWGTNLHQ